MGASVRHRVVAGLTATIIAAFAWVFVANAQAAPTIDSVATTADYTTVTITFSDDVTGSGTGGAIVAGDVIATNAGANLLVPTVAGAVLTLPFDGPVQPATAEISFTGTNVDGLVTGVPLAAADWTAIEAALRAVVLPSAGEVPIALTWMSPDVDGNPTHTLGELLPTTMVTSLDLPSNIVLTRDGDGTFDAALDGSAALTTESITPIVSIIASAAGDVYDIDLGGSGDPTIDVSIGLGGTIAFSSTNTVASGALSLELDAAGSPTLSGSVGFVGVSAATTLSLDATFGFDPGAGPPVDPAVTLTTAQATIDTLTIAGIGAGGSDIVVSPAVGFSWPSLPIDVAGLRTETVVATDNGWAAAGLLQLPNIGITDFLLSPGALATWLVSAQDVGRLSTGLPVVNRTLGDSVGWAETLAAAHNEIAAAANVLSGPFALEGTFRLTTNLCPDLEEARVRAADVAEAIAIVGAFDPVNDVLEDWQADVLAQIDGTVAGEAGIRSNFATMCSSLFPTVELDLGAGTVETSVSLSGVTFDFFNGADPNIDLALEAASLGDLVTAQTAGTWSGTSSPAINLTLGLKLASNADIFANNALVVDLEADDNPPGTLDENDVTVAHRIYVPATQAIATSTVSITGTSLQGEAEAGFLDLTYTGAVSVTPAATLTTIDPGTGENDSKVDLAELIFATVRDSSGAASLDTVVDVSLAGNDVDSHFDMTNSLIGTTSDVDIAGDVSGLFDGGDFVFQPTAVAGPGDVDPDTIAFGHTFGEVLNVTDITSTDVIAMVADLLEQLAENAADGAGDQTIPIIDVSLDEVAGFTEALSDVADIIRDDVPKTVSELEAFVNDALESVGMGAVTVGYAASGPSGYPELTLTLDAGLSESASFPVSFELTDNTGPLSIAPIDGGARLDAAIQIDFAPVLGISLTDAIPFKQRIFVRDVSARFDVLLSGAVDGGVSLGPLEANLTGTAAIGDSDLSADGITAAVTTIGGNAMITLADFPSNVAVGVSGSLPVTAALTLEVPLVSAQGGVTVSGSVPGGVSITTDIPNLRDLLAGIELDLGTLVTGAVETARFVARGAEEVSGFGDEIPVVGGEVGVQFAEISDTLDEVADVVEEAVEFLESNAGDPATYIEGEIDALLASVGCTFCDSDVYWLPDDPGTTLLNAEGIEVILTLADSVGATTSTSATLGLDPVLDIELDVTDATAEIGFAASIGLGLSREDGFYLVPGIDNGLDDGLNTLVELYADLDLQSTVTLTLAGLEATADATIDVGGSLNGGTAAGLKVDMPEQLPFADLVNRSRSFADTLFPSLDASVHAELPVTVEVGDGSVGLGLTMPFVFDWTFSDTLKPSFEDAMLDIVDAELDVQSLIDPLVDMLTEIEPYNPLTIKAVDDALTTEIPLIEQTVEEVINAFCSLQPPTDATCLAFTTLRGIAQLKADLEAFADTGTIPLGSFQIYPTPDDGVRYTPPANSVTQTANAVLAMQTETAVEKLQRIINEKTGGYMSLPILSEYAAIMGIVLGGELSDEVDIVRFEIPVDTPIYLGKSFALKKELFDLETGFIDGNLKISINGGIGLIISGGFGYSTRGIQTGNPFDGIFLIDNETAEISLGAALNAAVDGKFSVFGDVASVRFKGAGGFSATAGIDLFDESPVLVSSGGGGDGKLYFDEIDIIAAAYEDPLGPGTSFLCMFQLQTIGDWYLSFSGKAKVLGITVFNESFDESGELWNETISCTPKPRIARVENRQLILHAGPFAGDRFPGDVDIAESFDITTDGTNATVKWIPAGSKPDITFPLSSFDTILADMGVGADSVTVAEAITKPLIGRGGSGSDTFNGGGGADDLRGGDGSDTINGRAGNDTLRGGPGNDSLNGGTGADVLDGGADNDTATFGNGFGADSWTNGIGTDTLNFSSVTQVLEGNASYGDATIEASDGSVLSYLSSDVDVIVSGTNADTFNFKDQEPNGFTFDGNDGSDSVTFLSGRRTRQVTVSDSGSGDADTMTVVGTSAADVFLLRAASTQPGQTATNGFVAKLASGDNVDRYDYDDSIEDLEVDGALSGDTFALDDNAAATHIVGGQGDDIVQVGQVFGLADCDGNGTAEGACAVGADLDSIRGSAVGVDAADTFATTVITRGHLSNGVTHDLVVDGGDDDDTITIFANNAPVTANGGDGNDQFVARAFILTASVQLNGDGGIDDFTYVVNDDLTIDGGDGVDTFTVVGTEANDGFIVDTDVDGKPTVQVCEIDSNTGRPDPNGVCAISALVENVEVFAILGLEGDDVFWIRSSDAASLVQMSGGENSDRFLIGDGTIDGIDGPLFASGDEVGAVPAMPDPVVLTGEDATPAFDPAATGGTDRGDVLEIDASTDTTGLIGEITSAAVRGFGMADAPFTIGSGAGQLTVTEVLAYIDLEFAVVQTGGGDDVVTVTSTHVGNATCDVDGCPLDLLTGGGTDSVDVESIDGETTVDLGAGDDVIYVGSPAGGDDVLEEIGAGLNVIGGSGDDTADLDNRGGTFDRVDIDPGLITEGGMDPAGVSHVTVETVNLRMGSTVDVVNVRGTAADAVATHVYGNGGDERIYVSSAATYGISTETDHLGGDLDAVVSELFVHAGGGTNNLLMISDREAMSGDPGVGYDGASLTGLAPAQINHDAGGGEFGGGITIWTSEFDDTIAVTGTALSTTGGTRTLTVMNTGDGADDVTVTLDDTDGPFVLNLEEGDDTANAAAATIDLIVVGGLGGDGITTGSGHDTVLGDLGTVATFDDGTIVGNGGPGDTTDGGTSPIDIVTSGDSGGGVDTIATGDGEDVAFGGSDGDSIDGGADADLLVGGHTEAGLPDGGDTIQGGGGDDIIAGDNAVTNTAGVLMLRDLATTTTAAVAGSGGADNVTGGADNDAIYGQQGDDDLSGNGGDDTIEGNDGEDTISGGDGQDDLTGGGSALDGVIDADRDWNLAGVGLNDGSDTIDGDAGADVIAGDNATPDALGVLTLRDVATTVTAAPAGSGGDDTITGGGGADAIYGQQGDDDLSGDGGDDVIEGNDGEDTISGGDDQDDLIGGGSSFDGVIDADRNWRSGAEGLLDGNDAIDGGGDADVALGDNGRIDRPGETLGFLFGPQGTGYDDIQVRNVQASTDVDPDGTFGADLLNGGDGHDELHGQLDTTRTFAGIAIEGDELHGGDGEDVLIGDLGSVTVVLEDGDAEETIAPQGPFLEATIRVRGTLTYQVDLYLQHDADYVDEGDDTDPTQFGAEGDDVLFGDGGTDSIHGGSGNDLANGGAGVDYVFGGDGNDAIWGGPGDDELFGGHDEDAHDVLPRDFSTDNGGEVLGPDPAIWFEVAPSSDALSGLDVAYGGWNSDELQADVKRDGPQPADRLVDWAGAYNRYLSCESGDGAGTFLRTASPSMRVYFAELAAGRGAVDAATIGSSGDRELGLVQIEDMPENAGSVGGDDHVACP